jgi:hypothetical protein
MAKYLDGVQTIDDVIQEFSVIGSGTATVSSTMQYVPSNSLNAPLKKYRNYVLLMNNKSGQTINSINVSAKTTAVNTPVPNTASGVTIPLKVVTLSPSIGNNSFGTINWALIGY